MKLLIRSLVSGVFGGSLGGLTGMSLGLGHPPFNLSQANFRDGLMFGAILGLIPAVIIALLNVARYRNTPRRSTRLLAPLHSAALSFLSVSIAMSVQVGSIASC